MSGVKIADHHTESKHFLAHIEKEQQHGRQLPGRLVLDRPAYSQLDHRGVPPPLRRFRGVAELPPSCRLARGAGPAQAPVRRLPASRASSKWMRSCSRPARPSSRMVSRTISGGPATYASQ